MEQTRHPTKHLCNTCFYKHREGEGYPCVACDGYNKWVSAALFEPDTVTISTWDEEDAFVTKEVNEYREMNWDAVKKPKHYMLFEDKNIEVRDVIEKLADKINDAQLNWEDIVLFPSAPLFVSDYVQMMQYLMRFMDKNGVEDLKKARWYLDKMIQAYDGMDT